MLKQPKKTKYRKYFNKKQLPKPFRHTKKLTPLIIYTISALESTFLDARQLEAARQGIRRNLGRRGQLEFFFSPNIAVSKKTANARMGKGKGKTKKWKVAVDAGTILFKLSGVKKKKGICALKCGASKLPLRVTIF